MGFLDDLLSVMKGPAYVAVPLEDGESVVIEKAAGLLIGGKSIVGGKLVLTTSRLLFQPWDVRAVGSLLAQGLTKVGVPGEVGTAVGKVSELAATPRESELSQIDAAWASRDESVLSPPGLALRLSDGKTFEFGVLKSKLSPNFLPANRQHRDEILAAIKSGIRAP